MTKLRDMRQKKGVTQADLAYASRVSAPFMCDLEAGRRNARMDTWERIAEALGCSTEDIIMPNGEVNSRDSAD